MSRLTLAAILPLAAAIGCGAPSTAPAPAPAAAPASTPSEEGSDAKPATPEGSGMKTDADPTPVAFNPGGAPVVEFSAPGMHCEMCAATVVQALKGAPGVVDVKADAETKVVSLAVDEAAFNRDAAMAAIDKTGFGPPAEDSADDGSKSRSEG